MKKCFIHIFVAVLILSSAFPTFSVSALSSPRSIEPEPQILRDEQVRLDPLGPEAPGAAVFPEPSFQDRMPNADLPEEVRAHLLGQTEPVEESVYILSTAEQIAQTQAQVQSFVCTDTMDVPKTECEALVALYDSTNGAGWTYSDAWLTGLEVNNWYGVHVDDGNVVSLVLTNNLLSGSIPVALGTLTNLGYLDLEGNSLIGSIPPELGNLTVNLIHLYLSYNQLTGNIPTELDKLTNLQSLFLEGNQLTGSIPAELGNLTNLLYLYLERNSLSGSIPAELGEMSNLQTLGLAYNQLTGSIPPELVNLTDLLYLSLQENQLTGSIPPELGNLLDLYELYLYSNQLSGSIPLSFVNLTSLEVFYFIDTYLCEPTDSDFLLWKADVDVWDGTDVSCISTSYCITESEIPQAQCEALVALYNSTSGPWWETEFPNWFTVTPVSEWEGVALTGIDVTGLNLYGFGMKGNIPPEVGNLTNLNSLVLSYNQLTGSIPAELGDLSNLNYLSLQENQLSGSIPAALGTLTNLGYLDLSYNQLTGSIPAELGNLTLLIHLNLYDNLLSGNIPSELGTLSSLEYLDLTSNDLSGSIPPELGNLSSLKYLYLGDNQLSGGIPAKLGDLSNLQMLDLGNNQLTGSIPLSFVKLTSLEVFYIIDTYLCEPEVATFIAWKETVLNWFGTGLICHAPVAMADDYSTAEDSELVVTPTEGVLVNDTDEDGDTLTAELVANVANGSLVLVADGSFTYTPDPDFNGEDSFTYKVFDSVEYSEVVTVTIMVNQVLYSIYLPLIIK